MTSATPFRLRRPSPGVGSSSPDALPKPLYLLREIGESSMGIRRRSQEKLDHALRVFEVSQSLPEKWVKSDYVEKAQNPRNGLFELGAGRCKSCHYNKKAL
jgi:hypothetical protein